MNAEHKKLPVFGRRPLLPVGSGAPVGTRCVQLKIPDSDMAVRQLMGVLRLLIFWKSFEREASHYGSAWAEAWRAALAESVGGCDSMAIEFMQDDCGLYFREVGAETWEQIYDGLHCLESDGARSFFDGIIGDYIDQLIADGVLQRAGGQPGPNGAPEPGACQSYHVSLAANGQWLLPSPLGYGDTIRVTNVTGGWCDGTVNWFCPDGSTFVLGGCYTGGEYHDAGDPLNPGAYHMALIMQVGTTWFQAPTSLFTNLSGTTAIPVIFQANDGTLSDNSGNIEFDVEVCTENRAWCWIADASTNLHDGFPAIYPSITTWDTDHWLSGNQSSPSFSPFLGLKTDAFNSTHIDHIAVTGYNDADPTTHFYVQLLDANDGNIATVDWSAPNTGAFTHQWDFNADGVRKIQIYFTAMDYNVTHRIEVSEIRVWSDAAGTNPFGADNC